MANSNPETWQIWVDTGGTFTDSIAIDPQGNRSTCKVLSNGTLRGVLLKKEKERVWFFKANWGIEVDIFKKYKCTIFEFSGEEITIENIDFAQQKIQLSKTIKGIEGGTGFEITADEEAPVLAARLLTKTPLNKPFPPIQMRLGTTKGTNALLEQKGVPVALLITKGFADLLKIGTQQRPSLFQLNIPEKQQLYQTVIEVAERVDAGGSVLFELHESEIERILLALQKTKIKSVAIALMNAYKNPLHEEKLVQALEEAGILFVTASASLSPQIQILPRAETALVNAYLAPIIDQYLNGIKQALGQADILVMSSAGGLISANNFTAKDSLLSGPAGGIVAAQQLARELGVDKILTLDMGGTSTDTALYAGKLHYSARTKVGDANMLSASLAIETVAAGGGSICYFDGFQLQVGPESASAFPGPACYGAGGPLTISDVNLLLGKLDATAFSIPIHKEAAIKRLGELRAAINQAAHEEYSCIDLLLGFQQIANEKMAAAIRTISIRKGIDPKAYSLLAFGGVGGVHACGVSELLGIEQILFPFDAGIFSAYGMGQARIEKSSVFQALYPLESCSEKLKNDFENLYQKTLQELKAEGVLETDILIKNAFVYLRFFNQESTVELECIREGSVLIRLDAAVLETVFYENYNKIYGYTPNGKGIEVESCKLVLATKEEPFAVLNKSTNQYKPKPQKYIVREFVRKEEIPVYDWVTLREGATIAGPAVLQNRFAGGFVKEGWELVVEHNKNAILKKQIEMILPALTSRLPEEGVSIQKSFLDVHLNVELEEKEAIALELFTQRFMAIAETMGEQLRRTAFSVNIKERLDFSCALLDANAELLVNAPHIPVHLGSLGICARLILADFPLEKGDVIITNHPGFGGSHLPDVTLLCGVFDGKNQLVGYVINRAHHAEIGGSRPGSMPPDATNLEEEGVVIAPFYLLKNGVPNWAGIKALLQNAKYPSRSVTENLADINAALASLKNGTEALLEMVENYGLKKVHHYMHALKARAAKSLDQLIAKYGNQTFETLEKLDDGHIIKTKISFTKNNVTFDFAGTSPVHHNNLNANTSIVYSVVLYVLRLLCDEDIPLNEGLMQNVKVHLPNCFLNPDFPENPEACPAVVGGNTEVSQRLVDTLLKVFGEAACSQGTMNNFLFGNKKFGYYETIGGGCGAGNGFHGHSGIHQHMTNTKITDPEELERRYPVLLQEFALRKDSGGKGKWNGGDGLIRTFEFLEKMDITIISQHREEVPYGMFGGGSGKRGKQLLTRKNGEIETIKGIDSKTVFPGDVLRIETPGGGGFGELL